MSITKGWTSAGKVLIDALLTQAGFLVAYWIRYQLQWFRPVDEAFQVPYRAYLPTSLLLSVILLVLYLAEGAYSSRRHSWLSQVYVIFRATVTSVGAFYVYSLLTGAVLYSRLIFTYAGLVIVLLIAIARAIENFIRSQWRTRGHGVQRVLVVGAGEVGRTVMRNIVAHPELGYQVVGFVDDKPERGNRDLGRFKGLGNTENIPDLIARHGIDEVIVTLPWLYHRKILSIRSQCERARVGVKIVPDLFQISLNHVDIDDLNGIPLIGIKSASIMGWNLALKRAVDVLLGSVALVVLSPILLTLIVLIRLDSPGPVIFRQTRTGRGGRNFTVFKFRTMREGAELEQESLNSLNEASGPLFKIKDDPRRTRMGRFLRRFSLDELPQLYNVIKGEMSLIGPRPPLPSEVAQYQEWHKKRLQTWPGMTGLWQVSGRSELTFDEMVLLDIYYIENWSPLLDLTIALKTIPTLILGTGAY